MGCSQLNLEHPYPNQKNQSFKYIELKNKLLGKHIPFFSFIVLHSSESAVRTHVSTVVLRRARPPADVSKLKLKNVQKQYKNSHHKLMRLALNKPGENIYNSYRILSLFPCS